MPALVAVALGSAPAATADTTTPLVIDAAAVVRPVTHVGSGGLYALATATTPSVSQLLPLHLNQLTQPAPGVQQLGNGATVPTGDALKVADSATAAGAQQTVRMPDIYPNFPYRWVSWSDWLSKVDTMVNARLAATSTTNINGWELWNEPNWTWDTAAAGPFNDGWTRTYREVRSLDTVTPIVGPSIDRWDAAYMRDFLTAAKAAGTVPDIASWHELLNGWQDIPAHVAEYRAIESDLGISPRPISINEYAWTDQVDVPSSALHYIAQFERAGVRDAERAYWYESGTVNGLLHDDQPTGTYWLYDWYGGQTGNIVSVMPSGDQDAVAAYDSDRRIVDAVVGGAAGDNTVAITNLNGYGANARVSLDYTPNSGRMNNVASPTHLWTRTYPINAGRVDVPIAGQDAGGAYHVVVTPESGPATTYQQRYEAESATVVNGTRANASSASNGAYVTGLNNTGDARSDSFVDFAVTAPVAGTYDLGIRYGNGGAGSATQGLRVDGGTWQTVTYPTTGSASTFADTPTTALTLTQGRHVIRLAKGTPGYAGGTGSVALDSISLVSRTAVPAPPTPPDAPVATFVQRVEAENGTVTGGTIYPSGKASAGRFVGGLDSATSAVSATVTVPVTGDYTLAVGYANGGGFTQNGTSDAVVGLAVDGAAPSDLRLPVTGPWGVPGGTFPAVKIPLTLTAGSHTIALQHRANQNYAEFDYLQVSSPAGAFVDGRTTQTITFPTFDAPRVGGPDVPLTATASSGLTVGYTATGGCTIVGTSVHATAPGACTVTANQAGDATYDPAPSVSRTVTVAAATTSTVTPTITGTVGSAGWYTSKAIVALTPPRSTDRAQYRVDGGTWRTATSSFTLSDGAHTVDTRVVRNGALLNGSASSFAVPVDTVAPTTKAVASPSTSGTLRNPVTVTMSASDATSGVDTFRYRMDGGAWQPVTGPLVVGTVGDHVVEYVATDRAGIASTVRSVAVRISADPATRVAATTASSGGYATYTATGFHRYTWVAMTVGSQLMTTVLTDANGRAKVTSQVPDAVAPGSYQVSATDGELVATTSQKITESP